jgi:hypothetical protein
MISPKSLAPNRRIASRPAAVTASSRTKRMSKRRWLALTVAVFFAGAGLVCIIGHFWKDTRMADVIQLREKLLDPSLSAEDRQSIRDQVQQRMQSLMPELQKKAADGSMVFMQIIIGHMSQVLALPADKRMAAVDKDLDSMQSMSRMFGGGKQSGVQNGQAKGSSAWPGPQSTEAQRNAFRNQMLSSIPADSRAQFQNYRQLMQARAIQRGINIPGGGPR